MNAKKMSLKMDSTGRVTITYWCEFESEERVRTFTCAYSGGYVYELTSTDRRQVCERLSGMGHTLTAPALSGLPAVIRREYRRMKASHKRASV